MSGVVESLGQRHEADVRARDDEGFEEGVPCSGDGARQRVAWRNAEVGELALDGRGGLEEGGIGNAAVVHQDEERSRWMQEIVVRLVLERVQPVAESGCIRVEDAEGVRATQARALESTLQAPVHVAHASGRRQPF